MTYRLPRTVVPERYELVIAPDLDAATFAGEATILVRVTERVQEILLNAVELNVSSALLRRDVGPAADGLELEGIVRLDEVGDRLSITVPGSVPAGSWHLHLEFTGVLNDKLRGFYRSTFTTADGATAVIATTQFEPADARRAFPCWDEPDFKASFAVALIVDDGLTALSNGAVVADEPAPGYPAAGDPAGRSKRRVSFAETMLMSTYLVAFVVGPFELSTPADVDGVPLRVATVPGKSALTPFAVEAGTHALDFLARYFGLAYPHDKIDHVAIPDFAFGAMENLGCVTYRETTLLADMSAASQLELRRVAQVVAHETAHMWFGNLVTMKWWNGIWLNEAFATFMELTTTDHFRPDWHAWTAFGAAKAEALAIDSLRATRPIEFPVGPPEEAEAMFDALTYEKGGSVLRMLEQYLGPEAFRKGIAAYLEEHQYSNTETTDLWDAIETSSGEPVRSIMDSWIFQGGYPIVTVEAGDDGRSIDLHQRRFVCDVAEVTGGERSDGDSGERWSVPVNLRASIGGRVVRERALLNGSSATVTFDGQVDWVLVNDGAWGFYRVGYSDDLLGRLLGDSGGPAERGISALERMALVGDGWARVVAGDADLGSWVSLVAHLGDEDDPDVWSAMLGPLDLLDKVVDDADRPALQSYVRDLGGPVLERMGWDPDPGEDQRRGTLRSRVIAALGILGADDEVRATAARRFAAYQDDSSAIHPDLVTAVVHVVASAGGAAAYETMRRRLQAATTPQEQIRYLYALAQSDDAGLLRRTLDACLTDEVRSQDSPMLVGRVLANRAASAMAWQWIEDHWDEALDRFPNNIFIRMVDGVTSLVEPAQAERARSWLGTHRVPQAGPRLAQLLEQMDINMAFRRRVAPGLAAALAGKPR